jgi:uncharacterized protein YdeI (YjbR/CyaY-like superfamily)
LTIVVSTTHFFETSAVFRRWLEANHLSEVELVVGYHKVGSGRPSMSWPQSVEEALCFGWIDGVRKRIDDVSYQIRFTPRKARSIWSAVNIAKIEKLRGEGRMTDAGEAAFSRRTEARSGVYSHEQANVAELLPELARVFKKDKAAWAFFQSTPPGYRKVMLHWLASARKPETRDLRFKALVQACAEGKRLR